MRFIKEVIEDTIKVYRVKKDIIEKQLRDKKYKKYDNSYKYLTSMPLHNFTEEKISDLEKLIEKLNLEYTTLEKMSERDIWKGELKELVKYMKNK